MPMSAARVGALAGLILGVLVVFAGPWRALVVVAFGLVGLIIGRVIDGQLDLRDIFGPGAGRGRR